MRGKCTQHCAAQEVTVEAVVVELKAVFEAGRAFNLVQDGDHIVAHFLGAGTLVSTPSALDELRRLEVRVAREGDQIIIRYNARIGPLFARHGISGLIMRQVAKPFAKRRLVRFLNSVLRKVAQSFLLGN